MPRRPSIFSARALAPIESNLWLRGNSEEAEAVRGTISSAMTGKATLAELLQVVQSAFDAGRKAESQAAVFRIRALENLSLARDRF